MSHAGVMWARADLLLVILGLCYFVLLCVTQHSALGSSRKARAELQ